MVRSSSRPSQPLRLHGSEAPLGKGNHLRAQTHLTAARSIHVPKRWVVVGAWVDFDER